MGAPGPARAPRVAARGRGGPEDPPGGAAPGPASEGRRNYGAGKLTLSNGGAANLPCPHPLPEAVGAPGPARAPRVAARARDGVGKPAKLRGSQTYAHVRPRRLEARSVQPTYPTRNRGFFFFYSIVSGHARSIQPTARRANTRTQSSKVNK